MSKNRIAIVTGGAKGIGRAITQRLVDDNCYVILADADPAGAETAKAINSERVGFVQCDIRNEDEVKKLFENTISEHGKIDIVVNNAGIIRDNMVWKMSEEDFDLVIDVNLKGTWLMCREAASLMKEQQSGRIVNIASRAWLGNRGQSNYSASKAGIVGMTRVLALELGKYNVLVNAVAPGLIDTPLTQALSEDVRQKLILAQPTRTMGLPEDIANAVAFLAADTTNFITGQTIYVDGGKSIGAGI